MQAAYVLADILAPPVLLGRRLLPFTLGHAELLTVFESPFMTGGTVTHSELVFAVWICTRTRRAALDAIRGGTHADEVTAWGREVVGYDLPAASALLQATIDRYCVAPARWSSGTKKPARVPWFRMTAATLRRFFHVSEDEAWNTPCGEAFCQVASISAMLGDNDLMTDRDVAVEEFSAQLKETRCPPKSE